jgi:hypothetical protein
MAVARLCIDHIRTSDVHADTGRQLSASDSCIRVACACRAQTPVRLASCSGAGNVPAVVLALIIRLGSAGRSLPCGVREEHARPRRPAENEKAPDGLPGPLFVDSDGSLNRLLDQMAPPVNLWHQHAVQRRVNCTHPCTIFQAGAA